METIVNYFESFLFHYNEVQAAMDEALGIEYNYIDGWTLLVSSVVSFILVYFLGRSNIPDWIDNHDRNNRYSFVISETILLGIIYLAGGFKALGMFLCLGILLFAFYKVVLCNEKYAWLKERIYDIF